MDGTSFKTSLETDLETVPFIPPFDPIDDGSAFVVPSIYPKWCKRNLQGFDWDDVAVPYVCLEIVVWDWCRDKTNIVTKGLEKAKFLEKILNKPVLDLDKILLTKMDKLPEPSVECTYEHGESCAKINAYEVFNGMRNVSKLFE